MKISFWMCQRAYQVNLFHSEKFKPLWWAYPFGYLNSDENIRFGCDYLSGGPRFQTDFIGYGYLLK